MSEFKVPVWGWVAGAVALVAVVVATRSRAAAPAAVSGSNGNAPTPATYVLPQGANPLPPSGITVAVNRGPGLGPDSPESFTPPVGRIGLPAADTYADATLYGVANHFGLSLGDLTSGAATNPNLYHPGGSGA